MPDAWETLIDGSTIRDGDAWGHLNAQGGGVGQDVIVHADGIAIAIASPVIYARIEPAEVSIAVATPEIHVEVIPLEDA